MFDAGFIIILNQQNNSNGKEKANHKKNCSEGKNKIH